MGLHYSGPLLLWIEKNHPEYFEQLRGLVRRRQVEMVGGGFYEPILAVIPPEDQIEQITRLAFYLERHFGERAVGRVARGESLGAAVAVRAGVRAGELLPGG